MKIRRISYHFCPIPSFFLNFINFQIDNNWRLFRSKIIQMFFSIEDRFKTIFQKKTKLFERKEISIPLISALAPVFAYISYIYICIYIFYFYHDADVISRRICTEIYAKQPRLNEEPSWGRAGEWTRFCDPPILGKQ